MTDFECLMQLLGTEVHKDFKEHLMYLLKQEMEDAFKEDWIFPKAEFREMLYEIWDEIRDELKRKYKKQLKGKMEQKILELIERDDENGSSNDDK